MRTDILKRTFVLVSLIILFLIISFYSKKPLEEKIIHFSSDARNITLLVKIADTEESRNAGLMFVSELDEDEGMLFVYPDEKERMFWMKNTLIPLDMIFVSANETVVHVFENAVPCEKDPCETHYSKHPAMYVIEANAGFAARNKILAGDRLMNIY